MGGRGRYPTAVMRRRCALALAAFLLAACGSGNPQVVDGLTLLRYGDVGSGPAQVMAGAVRFTDGCIYLDTVVGDRWLLLWPPRSRLDAVRDELRVAIDDHSIGNGDVVSLAGGETVRAEAMAGPRVKDCQADRTWYVTGVVP